MRFSHIFIFGIFCLDYMAGDNECVKKRKKLEKIMLKMKIDEENKEMHKEPANSM